QPLRPRSQPGVVDRAALERPPRGLERGERTRHAALVVAVERGARAGRCAEQQLDVAEPLRLLAQRVDLPQPGLEGVDALQGALQPVELVGTGAGLGVPALELGSELPTATVGRGERGEGLL